MDDQSDRLRLSLNDFSVEFDATSATDVTGPEGTQELWDDIAVKFDNLKESSEGPDVIDAALQREDIQAAATAKSRLIESLGVPERRILFSIGFNSYRIDFSSTWVNAFGAEIPICEKIEQHFDEFLKTEAAAEFVDKLKLLALQLDILDEEFQWELKNFEFTLNSAALIVKGPDMSRALNVCKPAIVNSTDFLRLVRHCADTENEEGMEASREQLIKMLRIL